LQRSVTLALKGVSVTDAAALFDGPHAAGAPPVLVVS
jgi:hypothetical protein